MAISGRQSWIQRPDIWAGAAGATGWVIGSTRNPAKALIAGTGVLGILGALIGPYQQSVGAWAGQDAFIGFGEPTVAGPIGDTAAP
jgi:hypothetical protein